MIIGAALSAVLITSYWILLKKNPFEAQSEASPDSGLIFNAHISYELSKYAFCDREDYAQILHNVNPFTYTFKPVRTLYLEEWDVNGFTGFHQRENRIYVAFRGTLGWKNTKLDLQMQLVDYHLDPRCSQCKVHKGIQTVLESLYPSVVESIEATIGIYGTPSQIIVTGHSLGGAIASLCALLLKRDGYNVRLETFGAFRIGNDHFSKFADTEMD